MQAHGLKSRVTAREARPGVQDGLFPAQPVSAATESWDPGALDSVSGTVDRLTLTLESHLSQILARLRPDAEDDAEGELEQFGRMVEAAAEAGTAVEVEIPLAAENASMLPETVGWAASHDVSLIRVVPFRARLAADRAIDVFYCFSERYLERIQQLAEEAARDAGVPLVWELRAGRTFGLSRLPGVCEEVWGRMRVGLDDAVEPCMYGEPGELTLGRIGPDGTLHDVWDGPSARDLRRAHLTWDYPTACTTCARTLGPQQVDTTPFIERAVAELAGERGVEAPLEPLTPGPLARLGRTPVLRVRRPNRPIRTWHLAIAPGRDGDGLRTFEMRMVFESMKAVRLMLPDDVWSELEPNVGHWWAVFAQGYNDSWIGMAAARCMVRNQDLPRVKGSTLRYPDEATDPPVTITPRATGFLTPQYGKLVERVRNTVIGAVPEGAICVVATKGDDGLLDLGGTVAWHFPRTADGVYAGYNPPDGRWAVEHLEELRAAGAEYLVLPATAFWWREYYPELAQWLKRPGRLVLEERDTCLIVSLRKDSEEA